MAIKNPIDRKRKTSFLLGMVVMGVVTILIAAGLFMLLMNKDKELKKEKEKIEKTSGLCALRTSKKATEEILASDLETAEIVKSIKNEGVKKEIYKPGDKKAYAKIDLPAGTIVTNDMVYMPNNEKDTKINNTLRLYDVVGLTLPQNLQEGDVVDVRFIHPSLPDFIVLSKKKVEKADVDTIWLKLSESEIILLSSATLESYLIKGSKMYVSIYTDPGIQEASKITYPINENLQTILNIAVEEKNRDKVYAQLLEQQNSQARRYFLPNYGFNNEEEMMSTIQAGVNKDKNLRQRKRADYIQSTLAK